MPFGIHKHSNRSKQALNDPAVQGTGTPNSEGSASSPVFASSTDEAKIQPQIFAQQQRGDVQSQAASQGPGAETSRGTYQRTGDFPSRSQSTRYQSSPQQQPLGSADDLVLESRRLQQVQQQQQQQQNQQHTQRYSVSSPVIEPKKSKSLFDRMRPSNRASEQKSPAPPQNSYNNTSGLARRLSKRQESPPLIRTTQRNSLDQHQQLGWQSAQGSRSHLPSPQEGAEDDSGLDPYLITESEQDESHGAVHGQGQQQTIRPVQNDPEAPVYSTNEDTRQHFQDHQHQQQFDASSPSQYQHQTQQSNSQHNSLGTPQDQYRQQNPETVSQLSYESPIDQREEQQQRPVSVQSDRHSPTGGQTSQRLEYPSRTTSTQGPQVSRPLSQHTGMAPPTGASQQSRRSVDPKQALQGSSGPQDSRDGPSPGYRQQFPGNSTPTTGPGQSPVPQGAGNQGPNYRGGPPQRDQFGPAGGGEQGRSTPPPPAMGERDVNDAYKELLQKYKKVKGLYFDKTAQVEQLQNTLANQRLSQSRTSLDDSEYMTRFQRLDGATTNLAFNIRKDWQSIPGWLAPYVNQDAMKVGKQEMTAVGRACITKFLVDEIFNRSFHPGLEGELSLHLKNIEQNIRRFSPALNNQEESDALTAKVVQWRLATLDGLRDVLNTAESEENRKQFSRIATSNLTASLINFLVDPVPPGIEDSAHMIVELAVSIAANLPLESRDISIIYPMPGDLVQPLFMKVEAGIPGLENPGVDTSSEVDASSTGSGDKDETPKETEKSDGKNRKEKAKSTGVLQAMMGGGSQGVGPKKQTSLSSQGPTENSSDGKGKPSGEDGPQKVRFAGFVGIEVRGRQMLGKAPVWAVS